MYCEKYYVEGIWEKVLYKFIFEDILKRFNHAQIAKMKQKCYKRDVVFKKSVGLLNQTKKVQVQVAH